MALFYPEYLLLIAHTIRKGTEVINLGSSGYVLFQDNSCIDDGTPFPFFKHYEWIEV